MTVVLAIAPEGAYSDIEHDLIENEPPGLFPTDQNSYWGQVRKLQADYLQVLADQLSAWYVNLDPSTVDINDISEWEEMLAVPQGVTGASLDSRRSFVMSRHQRGAFTHARRRNIVESFINATTFGDAPSFGTDGLTLDVGGISLFSGETSFAGLYAIVESIEGFTYSVRIKNTITVDDVGLARELRRVTPRGINFDIVYVASPGSGGGGGVPSSSTDTWTDTEAQNLAVKITATDSGTGTDAGVLGTGGGDFGGGDFGGGYFGGI